MLDTYPQGISGEAATATQALGQVLQTGRGEERSLTPVFTRGQRKGNDPAASSRRPIKQQNYASAGCSGDTPTEAAQGHGAPHPHPSQSQAG